MPVCFRVGHVWTYHRVLVLNIYLLLMHSFHPNIAFFLLLSCSPFFNKWHQEWRAELSGGVLQGCGHGWVKSCSSRNSDREPGEKTQKSTLCTFDPVLHTVNTLCVSQCTKNTQTSLGGKFCKFKSILVTHFLHLVILSNNIPGLYHHYAQIFYQIVNTKCNMTHIQLHKRPLWLVNKTVVVKIQLQNH